MDMNKRRRIRSSDGKTPLPELPEAMIQHIQSYMNRKEAARTTLLSKSWRSAWLTRPILDLDERDFKYGVGNFEKFATKAIRWYRKLGFKIESFRLYSWHSCNKDLCRKLIVKAMKIGATDLQIEMTMTLPFTLPKQVLGSQTLVRLSLTWCTVDGSYVISCPTLKSLTFDHVTFTNDDDDVFCDILTSCNASIEELSLSSFYCSSFRMSTYVLHKLRRLFLFRVDVVDVTIFSNDFASRFPCLEELSILDCGGGCTRIRIASTSLQTISIKPWPRGVLWSAKFDVPSIQKFTYSGWGSPSSKLSIKAEASREWEFDISIHCNQLYKSSWFLNLKKYLTKYRLSRISIFVNIVKSAYMRYVYTRQPEQEVEIEAAPKPLVVDNLMIDGPSSYRCALLVRLFGICRPKFITHCPDYDNVPLDFLCEGRSMFGQFGLKEVKVELLPSDASQTPKKKQKIRYHLIWNE